MYDSQIQPQATAVSKSSKSSQDSLSPYSSTDTQDTLFTIHDRLERLQTRESVVSKASVAYNPNLFVACADGDDDMPSGLEFKEDPDLVTWESIEDPMNPRNWGKWRKIKITALASLQSIIPTLGSSILAPVIPNILKEFNNSNLTVGSLMVSILVMQWGISSVIWSPMSEVVGRRTIMVGSAFFNFVFTLGCALAPNTASMLVFRALQGLFNGVPISMGAGAIADIYNDKDRQWPLAIWDLAPCCGPAIAPIIGGWVAQTTSWRWVFWTMLILQGAGLVLLTIWYEETYPQILLAKKRDKLIKKTSNHNLHTIWDLNKIPFTTELKLAVKRPCAFLILNPIIFLLSIYLAFTYGFMYLILTDFPALWKEVYHFKPGIGGMMYLGYGIGMAIGVFFWTSLINWWYERQKLKGYCKLEERLFWLPFSTVVLAAGMLWYGWSAEAKLPWIMPVIGIGMFAFALFCVFQAVQAYVVSLNARLAGSIMAACVLFRSFLAGTFPLFGRAMYDKLGYGWSSTVVALLAIVLGVPWPIGIYIYGPQLRKWVDDHVKVQ